jgi:hypothetical protein
VLVIPEYHTAQFEAEFEDLVFPHIKTLVVGSYCDFAARLCPNLQTISSNGWLFKESRRNGYRNHTFSLIRAAASVPNVTRLEINDYWDPESLGGKIQLTRHGSACSC